jgi:hypothetical protein
MADTKPTRLQDAAPVFVVEDVTRSVEYVRDALGFRVEFTYGKPACYAGVERDNVLVHLQAASDSKRKPGHGAINVCVSDVDILYATR